MDNGRLALVRFSATENSPETLLVEITLSDEQITITRDTPDYRVTPEIRELAQKLIELTISEVEKNGSN